MDTCTGQWISIIVTCIVLLNLTMVEQTNNTYKSSYRISQDLLGLISNLFCSVRCGLVIFVVPSGR